MSSIEGLKEKARRHEQKEDWKKALDLYQTAIDKLEEEEQPDIGLYNRVGDLQTRLGNLELAVASYERAVDLYLEAELPNNAIAVCKKIIRNMPMRNSVYLKMGQIRAEQGFAVDARQNFLTYAERTQAAGDIDEALRALIEFADLVPDDAEIRMAIAGQLEQNERVDEAVEQLVTGYQTLMQQGKEDEAQAFADKAQELDPSVDLSVMPAAEAPAAEEHAFDDYGQISFQSYDEDEEEEAEAEEVEAEFGEIEIPGAGEEEPDAEAVEDEAVDVEVGAGEVEGDFGEFDISGDEEEEEAEPLPTMGFDDDEEEAEPLPTMGFDDDEEEAEPLPTMEFDDDEEEAEPLPTIEFDDDEEEAEPLPTMEFDDEEEAEPLPTMEFDDDEEEAESIPTMELDEEEEAEPLPTMELDEEEEAEAQEEPAATFPEEEEAAGFELDEQVDEEATLDAAAFGESDRGERETREYLEGGEEMEEVEAALSFDPAADESGEAGEEADMEVEEGEPVDAVGEAVEAAAEEAVAEERAEAPERTPADVLEEGRRRAAEGDADEAVRLLREAQEGFDRDDDLDGALEATRALAEQEPDEVDHRQRMVELAFRKNDDDVLADAYMALADTLERTDEPQRAQALYQQVLSLDPDHEGARAALGEAEEPSAPVQEVASSEDYVDLGSMILDEEEEEKTTRFTVAYEEPSGDEQADFAKMLSQFKQKVSENVSADDVKAHHDLGTAYKEMGLMDEAVEEFQAALRASSGHLPTYELLGQCFIEKGELDAAVRTLRRALDVPHDIEDELLGIYYYLGRAEEERGNTDAAVEFYDRVFALDINFADVTERLRSLR